MYTLNVFLSMHKFSNTGVGNLGVIKTFTILDSARNQASLSPNLSLNYHGHREERSTIFPGQTFILRMVNNIWRTTTGGSFLVFSAAVKWKLVLQINNQQNHPTEVPTRVYYSLLGWVQVSGAEALKHWRCLTRNPCISRPNLPHKAIFYDLHLFRIEN